MSNKKYQVFISSTYADLVDERRKVLDILLMADCIPSGMEAFVATDAGQFDVIKKVIDLCDYYVLILGQRYGSMNPDTGISYTEMEYEYAKSKGIPVLVFAIDEGVELPAEKRETDTLKIDSLNRFKKNAMDNRLASIWKTASELTGAIAIAIMRAKNEIVRPGWQRATDYDEASLRRRIMELEDINKDTENKLAAAQETIKSFSEQKDVAFDNCSIDIDYDCSRYDYYSPDNGKKTMTLPELFKIISTEMMDVTITEDEAKYALIEQVFGSAHYFSIDDDQFMKRILNQFKALNLLYSQSDKNHVVNWGLTDKGIKKRDDMILIRNQSKLSTSE